MLKKSEEFDSRMQEFENDFQRLLLLSGTPTNIDEFVSLYTTLGICIKENLFKARTLAEVKEWRTQGRRLKELLKKQVGYVKGLKDVALINEFETLDNDTGMEV